MMKNHILWADDEIDLLKPHILFLESKGYQVTAVLSGTDAIEQCEKQTFDVVFLDENMPGMSGLETLEQVKRISDDTPVVMITKSEEEQIMEEAIGAKIADYLIKPINPNQILLSLKRILDKRRLVSEKTNSSYQQDFQQISMAFMDDLDYKEWSELYKKISYWDLEINQTENKSMMEVLEMQKAEANVNFAKYIKSEYKSWLHDEVDERPFLSHEIMKEKVFPTVENTEGPVFFILIDNLRYDQWKVIAPLITPYAKVKEEFNYYAILPTATAYARNAIFSGLMPSQIKEQYPHWWVEENEEESKNNHELELLNAQLDRLRKPMNVSYTKVMNMQQGKHVLDKLNNMLSKDLNVLVYNFVDMLSHARTETQMIRELAPDDSAYRSITKSWFEHSSLLELIKRLSEKGVKIFITTDHGTTLCKKPYKIVGDRETNTNLRYKLGKNLSYDKKKVFEMKRPEEYFLPSPNLSTSYVFATEDYFFAYPNNYNHYVKYYNDTFQHGGISMEEMIIPFVELM